MANLNDLVTRLRSLPKQVEQINHREMLQQAQVIGHTSVKKNILERQKNINGVTWPPHKPSTVKRMGPHGLLTYTFDMINSLTGGAGCADQFERKAVFFDTEIPYFNVQNYGGNHIPSRQCGYLHADEAVWMGIMMRKMLRKKFDRIMK